MPEVTDQRSKVTMAAHRSAIEPPSAANRSSCDEGKVAPGWSAVTTWIQVSVFGK